MRIVERHAMVPYSAEQMYALVDNIEAYAEFLPWCTAASLVSRTDSELVASLTIGYGALNSVFTTRNELQPSSSMNMELLDGPFTSLEGRWEFETFAAGGGESEEGCEVRLRVAFEFASTMQDMLFGRAFENICNELIGAFTERADALYGSA